MPRKIGVVTSSTGAAIRDIITVIKRRYPIGDILIYPVLVQGDLAPKEICEGLNYLNSREDVDVIITGRGGALWRSYLLLMMKRWLVLSTLWISL